MYVPATYIRRADGSAHGGTWMRGSGHFYFLTAHRELATICDGQLGKSDALIESCFDDDPAQRILVVSFVDVLARRSRRAR